MRALRGEGLAGGRGSVCPSRCWGPCPRHLPSRPAARHLPEGSVLSLPSIEQPGMALRQPGPAALVVLRSPSPPGPLAEPRVHPCPAQPHAGLPPACRCCPGTGDPRLGPVPQGVCPVLQRGAHSLLSSHRLLLPAQPSTGWWCWGG